MGDPWKRIGLLRGSSTRRIAFGVPCLLLLVSGGWIALASHGPDAAGDTPQAPGASALQPPASRLVWSDPNLSASPSVGLGNSELFLRMMLSVGLIIGLGAAALYLSKRALPRGAKASGKEIHVLETAYLGPRKALHLVEVGGQRLLIASTSDSVTMLASLSETWPDVPKAAMEDAGNA